MADHKAPMAPGGSDRPRGGMTFVGSQNPAPIVTYVRVVRSGLKLAGNFLGLSVNSKPNDLQRCSRWATSLDRFVRFPPLLQPFHHLGPEGFEDWGEDEEDEENEFYAPYKPRSPEPPSPETHTRKKRRLDNPSHVSYWNLTTQDIVIDERPITHPRSVSTDDEERQARFDKQFGPIGSPTHRYVSKHGGGELVEFVEDEPGRYYIWTAYLSYSILTNIGRIRDFFGKRFRPSRYKHLRDADGYAPLNSDFENFYFRRFKTRLNDCFARPITGVPGRYITLMDRESKDRNKHFELTGTYTETLNLSSYNYLGFAQSEGYCADTVEESIKDLGISYVSPRSDSGTTDLVVEVEREVANFVGKPDAMVFSTGFSTNSTTFAGLIDKGCLIISDELNHSSIRVGSRISGATIRPYKHNNMDSLERLLRRSISEGQPGYPQYRPWRKILLVAEGLYSMEGTIVDLPGLVRLKEKYKFYLFIDEAHSIGALGPRGRGVCDYFDMDPSRIDILMGTFTKSFGANGGYVAADKHIIDKLRSTNAAMPYAETTAPPVLMQILSSLRLITGEVDPGQGMERLQRIAFNARYLRLGLKRLGFILYGHDDSPVVPLIIYHPAKLQAFSHEMLRRKIAIVITGYPATALISGRARFCLSAAHNKEDLDRILVACDEVGDLLQLKFSTGIAGGTDRLDQAKHASGSGTTIIPPRWSIKDVLEHGVEDVKAQMQQPPASSKSRK
jgi:serine palmitoyltransferase